MLRLRPLALSLLAVLSLGSVASTAAAQDDAEADQHARAHFAAASAYYGEGDYERALVEFRSAYAGSGRAALLYNIYLCEERLAHLAQAIEALEGYLASDAEIANRATLETRLGHLRERLAQGETTTDAQEVTTTTAAPSPPPPVAPPPSSGPSALAIAGFAVAGVGLVSFAVFGALTLSEADRLHGACSPNCTSSDTSLIGATGIVSDVSAAVALAGAVLGVIGLVVGNGGSSEATTATLRIGPTGGSAEVHF